MMQAHEIILDYFGKITKLPYRGIISVVTLTFIVSVTLSIFLSKWITPDVKKAERASSKKVFIKKEKETLNLTEIEKIIGRNIFNKTGEVPKEDLFKKDVEYTGEAVKSELPLKLKGVIFGGDPKHGLAFIEDVQARKGGSFLVGDSVRANAELAEVHEEKIILLVDDHREYIELEKKEISRGKRSKKRGSSKGQGTGSSNRYIEEGFERDGNTISMSSDYRKKLLTQDFAKVLQDAKAEPVYEGGELNGFRLTRIRSESVYEKGGLLNEDIVKEINGVSLVDTAQTIKLLNSLRAANSIEIGVMRGGKKINVSIQVK